MDKIPAYRPASSSARSNPSARRPAATGANAPRENAPTPPASPEASAASPHARPSLPPHARPQGGLQGEGHAPGSNPGEGPDDMGSLAAGLERLDIRESTGSAHAPEAPGTSGAHANRPMTPDPAALHLERTYAMMDRQYEEMNTRIPQSRPNGFKLMTPRLRDAISQSQAMFPPNIRGFVSHPREHAVVFHEDPSTGRLVPGGRGSGNDCMAKVPEDIAWPSARVVVHSHPYTGRHFHDFPSMADQLLARGNPHVEHIVQTPADHPGKPNKYRIYTGAYPPRFHTLVENPLDLPASPHSSDGESTPPFREHPFK